MTTAALKASLALWQRRYAARLKLRSKARQALLEARTGDVHPRQHLVERQVLRDRQAEEALRMIKRREKQIEAKQKGKVHRPYERIKANVRNQSSRNGVRPKIIVLHSTESHNRPGVQDLQAIVSWFDNPKSQASSHVIVDGEGISARCVPDHMKAWTQASYNPQALSIEQIGFAAQSSWSEPLLRKTAKYIAYWSVEHGIPIERSTSHGVCMHSELGAAGGGHHDPGQGFPMGEVLSMARSYAKNGW